MSAPDHYYNGAEYDDDDDVSDTDAALVRLDHLDDLAYALKNHDVDALVAAAQRIITARDSR